MTPDTNKRAHGCELAALPGSRFVWINHFAGFNGPEKVRLLKVIEGGEDNDWPFLIGARIKGQRRLGKYRWAHIYTSRRAADAAQDR